MATKNIKLDELTAKKLYKTASPELRVILEENFTKAVLSSNPRDLINHFTDVLKIVGSKPEDEIPYYSHARLTKRQKSQRAFAKLQLIIEAYNMLDEKPELNWLDRNQPKYYLYFERKPGGWVLGSVFDGCWFASVGAGFYFKSRENVQDCYEKFKDVWDDYLPE